MSTIGSTPPGRVTILAEGKTGAPRISGDGRVVVWTQQVGDDWAIMKNEDGVTTRVSEEGFDCTNAEVSADGSVIAYARLTPPANNIGRGNFDVYQYRDGENTPVSTGPGNEYSVAVSPDGSTIAWDDDFDGSWGNWRVGKWQNGEATYLTDGTVLSEFPFISDSNRVYFRQRKYENSFLSAELENGKIQAVAYGPGDTIWGDATADDKTIVWTDNSDEFNDILRQDNGTLTTDVSEEGVDHTWARINNDGSRMVWTAFDRRGADPSRPKVSVMYRENGQTEAIAIGDSTGMPVEPDLSDDGSKLAWFWVGADNTTRIVLLERDQPAPESSTPA